MADTIGSGLFSGLAEGFAKALSDRLLGGLGHAAPTPPAPVAGGAPAPVIPTPPRFDLVGAVINEIGPNRKALNAHYAAKTEEVNEALAALIAIKEGR